MGGETGRRAADEHASAASSMSLEQGVGATKAQPMTDAKPLAVDAPPAWLTRWQAEGVSATAALAQFDALAALSPAAMLGRWRGRSLATGHPLDGLLEPAGWYGKEAASVECVHPLLLHRGAGPPIALDPALLPVGLALRVPALGRSRLLRAVVALGLPLLRTQRPAARLREIPFRGEASAAMLYDRQPIIDHFRRIDAHRVLGLMVYRPRPLPYFFFCLEREATPPPAVAPDARSTGRVNGRAGVRPG